MYAGLQQWLGPKQPHFFWCQGSQVVIGVGALGFWSGMGRERFLQARQGIPATPGFWLGGFGFSDRDPSFFFSPRITVHGQPGNLHLTIWDPEVGDPAELLALLTHREILPPPTVAQPPQDLPFPPLSHALERALAMIHQGSLEKIVLAAPYTFTPDPLPSLPQILSRLCQLYPDCTVFACDHPQGGVFLGASPETLVKVQGGQLHTVALAGSRPRHRDPEQDRALGLGLLESTKDRYEQHLVTESIVSALQSLGITPRLPSNFPTLRRLSHIQHLQTPISAALPPHLHILDLVAALHPTAAVAGLPRERACGYLPHLETFERTYYAAPIGWLDPQGEGEFIVGIRSAWLCPPRVTVYAGAGIVAGSEIERELTEITWKWQTLLPALIG